MQAEKKPNNALVEPTLVMAEDMKRIDGDISVLGAGGKMGCTICALASKAVEGAGTHKKVIVVSRLHDLKVEKYLEENHVEMIQTNLQDLEQLENLPEVPNAIYVAGRRSGAGGQKWTTWGADSILPVFVGEKCKKSGIVVSSPGNIYPIVPLASGGCTKKDKVAPMEECAQSCPTGEHTFEYYSSRYGAEMFMYRLNSAVDLGYGVLTDITDRTMDQALISVITPCLNYIWQGSATGTRARSLLHASNPPEVMNVTGPEMIPVKKAVKEISGFLGRESVFKGEESSDAYLNNIPQAMEQFGYLTVPIDTSIRWQVEWVTDGGRNLGLPTYSEKREGHY